MMWNKALMSNPGVSLKLLRTTTCLLAHIGTREPRNARQKYCNLMYLHVLFKALRILLRRPSRGTPEPCSTLCLSVCDRLRVAAEDCAHDNS
jgi:hypothetical protein